jgi:biotin carboxyl carrier protein
VTPRTLEDVQCERELIAKTLQQARVAGRQPAPQGGAAPAQAAHTAPAVPLPRSAALQAFEVYVNGERFRVEVGPEGLKAAAPVPAPAATPAAQPAPAGSTAAASPAAPPATAPAEAGTVVTAPLPGLVVGYRKKAGDAVRTGETVVVLEAMKMHNNIEAPCDGTLAEVHCREGDTVPKGQPLFRIA